MRVLHLYCHPVPESFHGAIRAAVLEGLGRAGHEVDLLDLYAEGFDPVLGAVPVHSRETPRCAHAAIGGSS